MKGMVDIFKLNIKRFPDSWNVYDSLAEAYMKNDKEELAIKYYEKSFRNIFLVIVITKDFYNMQWLSCPKFTTCKTFRIPN